MTQCDLRNINKYSGKLPIICGSVQDSAYLGTDMETSMPSET